MKLDSLDRGSELVDEVILEFADRFLMRLSDFFFVIGKHDFGDILVLLIKFGVGLVVLGVVVEMVLCAVILSEAEESGTVFVDDGSRLDRFAVRFVSDLS